MYDIIIKQAQEEKQILLIENGNLVEIYHVKEESIEGNIYLGKVQNVLQGMQAAFINIGENKNTFIHLKDILPKKDTKKTTNIEKTENIKELIRPGNPILVQVKRAECNNKGARVSSHISLSGRYIVLLPETEVITISQKIENSEERKRLLEIIKKILPKNCGAIVRTSATKKSKEEIEIEVKELFEKWEKTKKASQNTNQIPRLLYKNDNILKKMLIDLTDKEILHIIVNTKELEQQVEEILQETNNCKIQLSVVDEKQMQTQYDLQKQIEKANNRKIWLKCGGFVTIDKTEALTAIDVNSGKYIGTKNLEQTVYTVNKEATIEIAKQLKLRDIGGIIIIDYIDMKEKENQEKIQELLKEELKKDRSKTQIMGFSKLNLLEMTRKHILG